MDKEDKAYDELRKIIKSNWSCVKKMHGIRESNYWTDKNSPHHSYGGWRDHLKTWTYPTKEKVFVSEPYHIFNEDILEMARLIRDGWEFSIDGNSPHYPGRTVHIKVSRK